MLFAYIIKHLRLSRGLLAVSKKNHVVCAGLLGRFLLSFGCCGICAPFTAWLVGACFKGVLRLLPHCSDSNEHHLMCVCVCLRPVAPLRWIFFARCRVDRLRVRALAKRFMVRLWKRVAAQLAVNSGDVWL